MKKKFLTFMLTLCLILPCAILFSACGKEEDPPKAVSISVSMAGESTYYLNGDKITTTYGENLYEALDKEEFVVTATYDDNSQNTITDYTITSTFSETGATVVGNYTMTFSYGDLTAVVIDVEVTPAEFTIADVQWSYTQPFTYEYDTQREVVITNVPVGVQVQYSGNTATDAGHYTAIATFTCDDPNYTAVPPTATINWDINKATYSLPANIELQDYTYNATERQAEIVDAIPNIQVTYSGDSTATIPGTYYATLSFEYTGADAENYEEIEDITREWTISRGTVTEIGVLTLQDASLVYDGTYQVVQLDTSSLNSQIVVKTDEITGNTAREASEVGQHYTATIPLGVSDGQGGIDPYYDVESVELNWTIAPKELRLIANDNTITYGEQFAHNGYRVDENYGFVNGEDTSYIVSEVILESSYEQGDDATTYAINIRQDVIAPNYTVSYVAGTLTVNKAPYNIMNAESISLVDNSLEYNGANQTVQVDTGALALIDPNVEVDVANSTGITGKNVSSVYIANIALKVIDNDNYFIQSVEIPWSITPKTLTVAAKDKTITYGDEFASAGYGYDVNGLVGEDIYNASGIVTGTAEYDCAYTQGCDSGTYVITIMPASLTENSGNYTLEFETGTLTVEQALLYVNAGHYEIEYGETPKYVYSTSDIELVGNGGLLFEDTLETVLNTLYANISYTNNEGEYEAGVSDIGTYDIKVTGLTANNYKVICSDGTLLVKQKVIDASKLAWQSNKTLEYTGSIQSVELNLVDGIVLSGEITYNKTPYEVASDYTANATVVAINENYKVEGMVPEFNFSIVKARINLSIHNWVGSTSYEYDGNDHKPTFSYESDSIYSYTVKYYASTDTTRQNPLSEVKNVGSYIAVIEGYYDTTNYQLYLGEKSLEFEFTITKAYIDVTSMGWSNAIYDETYSNESNTMFEKEIVYSGTPYTSTFSYNAEMFDVVYYDTYINDEAIISASDISVTNSSKIFYAKVTIKEAYQDNYAFSQWGTDEITHAYQLTVTSYPVIFSTLTIDGQNTTIEELLSKETFRNGTVIAYELNETYTAKVEDIHTVKTDASSPLTIDEKTFALIIYSGEEQVLRIGFKQTHTYIDSLTINGMEETNLYTRNYTDDINVSEGQNTIEVVFDKDYSNILTEFYFTLMYNGGEVDKLTVTSATMSIPVYDESSNRLISIKLFARVSDLITIDENDDFIFNSHVNEYSEFGTFVFTVESFNGQTTEIRTNASNTYFYNQILTGVSAESTTGEVWNDITIYTDSEMTEVVGIEDLNALNGSKYVVVKNNNGDIIYSDYFSLDFAYDYSEYEMVAPNNVDIRINVDDVYFIITTIPENENITVRNLFRPEGSDVFEEVVLLMQDVTFGTYRFEATVNGVTYYFEVEASIYRQTTKLEEVLNESYQGADITISLTNAQSPSLNEQWVVKGGIIEQLLDTVEVEDFGTTIDKFALMTVAFADSDVLKAGYTLADSALEVYNGIPYLVLDINNGTTTKKIYIEISLYGRYDSDTSAEVRVSSEVVDLTTTNKIIVSDYERESLSIMLRNSYAKAVIYDKDRTAIANSSDGYLYYSFAGEGFYSLVITATDGTTVEYEIVVRKRVPVITDLFTVQVDDLTLKAQMSDTEGFIGDFMVQEIDETSGNYIAAAGSSYYYSGHSGVYSVTVGSDVYQPKQILDQDGTAITPLSPTFNLNVQGVSSGYPYIKFTLVIDYEGVDMNVNIIIYFIDMPA